MIFGGLLRWKDDFWVFFWVDGGFLEDLFGWMGVFWRICLVGWVFFGVLMVG